MRIGARVHEVGWWSHDSEIRSVPPNVTARGILMDIRVSRLVCTNSVGSETSCARKPVSERIGSWHILTRGHRRVEY